MADQCQLLTLLLIFILCFSIWPTSVDTSSVFPGEEEEKCSYDCEIKHYTSTYGVQCDDYCGPREEETYYWCNSQKGWDYCSPSNNVDYHGDACKTSSPCDRHGKSYYWCYLEKGGWDYCGQVLPTAKTHKTSYQNDCIDPCRYDGSKKYHWCYTEDSWEYCSPKANVTYKNVSCRSDHSCDTHNSSYNWCYTDDNNNWDYCGATSFITCMHPVSHQRKPSLDNPRNMCTWEENSGSLVTVTEVDAKDDAVWPNSKIRDEALELIGRWRDDLLRDQPVTSVLDSLNLHLDIMGMINVHNQSCYDLQIQQKTSHGERETTISQLICTYGISTETMRWAFRRSLMHQTKIVITRQ